MGRGPGKPALILLEGGETPRTQELAIPTSPYGRFAAHFLSRGKNGPFEAAAYIMTVLRRGETVVTIPGDNGHVVISGLVTFFETSGFLDTKTIRELRKMLGEAEQDSEADAVAAAQAFAAFDNTPTGEWSPTATLASIDTGDGPFRSGNTDELVSWPPTAVAAPDSLTYQNLKEAIEEASPQKGFRYNGTTEVIDDYSFETDTDGNPLLSRAEKKKIEVRTGVSLLKAIFTAAQEHKITSAERTDLATECTLKMVRERDIFATRDLLACLKAKLTTPEELKSIIEAALKIDPAFTELGDHGEELLLAIGLGATAAPKATVEQVAMSGEEEVVLRKRKGLWLAGSALTFAFIAGGVASTLRGQKNPEEDQPTITAQSTATAPSSAPKPAAAQSLRPTEKPATVKPASSTPTAKTSPPKPATTAAQEPATQKPPEPAPTKAESAPTTVTLPIKLTPESTIDPASAAAWQKEGWQITQQMVGIDPISYSFKLKRKGQTLVIPGNTFAPGQTSITLPIQ